MSLPCCGLTFMIRRQRNQLVRELWRLRASLAVSAAKCSNPSYQSHGSEPPARSTPPDCRSDSAQLQAELKLKSALHSLLKRLDMEELENLLESIKSRGTNPNNQCILLPQPHNSDTDCLDSLPSLAGSITYDDLPVQRLALKAWRWYDLCSMDVIRCLPSCQHSGNSKHSHKSSVGGDSKEEGSCYSCINPYHWSRVVLTDVKPPTGDSIYYRDSMVKKLDPTLLSTSTETETTGGSEYSSCRLTDYWCRVGYRELSEHVGQLFPVIPSSIDIFQDIPQGSGISLSTLHKSHTPKSDKVESVRLKIGAGVTLSTEGDKVWLYNRGNSSIFVSSYSLNITIDQPSSWRVYKVNPGYCINIYDYQLMEHWSPDPYSTDGPTDPHSIHISFVKGWGRDYHRQNILSCACWLEVILNTTAATHSPLVDR